MALREHLTLTAATVGTLPITAGAGRKVDRIKVEVGGTGAVNFTIDGSTPTVDGDDTYRLDPGETREFSIPTPAVTVSVKAISAGTPTVSAEALSHSRDA